MRFHHVVQQEGSPPELGRHVMADRDPKVIAMVERELKKNPKVSGAELQKKAKRINKAEAELSPRSFNARYPLPVRKKLSGRTGGRKKGTTRKVAPKTRMTSDLKAAINSLIEKEIETARKTFNSTLDSALNRARKSGSVDDFEKIHAVIVKARGMF